MSQLKLNSFFTTKKNVCKQPSKRRKVEVLSSEDNLGFITDNCPTLTRSLPVKTNYLELKSETLSTVNTTDKLIVFSATGTKGKTISKNKHSGIISRKKSTTLSSRQQTKLTDLFSTANSANSTGQSAQNEGKNLNIATAQQESKNELPSLTVYEEITSVWDDQSGNCATPRKRALPEGNAKICEESESQSQRKKVFAKRPANNEQPEKKFHIEKTTTARKRLQLVEEETSPKNDCDQEVTSTLSGKSHLLNLVSLIPTPPAKVVSPLPASPVQDTTEEKRQEFVNPKAVKLQNLTKDLTKMKTEAVKSQLRQSSKLPELKTKLDRIKSLKTKKTESPPVSHDVEVESPEIISQKTSVPLAFQRFDPLAEDGPPTLCLPYSYKALEGVYQSVEQVVSMLHNRSEICTFSKLQSAVQNITRKNFELKSVGQIKTIVPEAYNYRQEKNIPQFGKQLTDYHLTIEPNLEVEGSSNDKKFGTFTAEGKPMFTASLLLKRQHQFKNNLLDYLKHHHRKFLATLKNSLNVPDDKITRWHPLFQLDKVPAVTPSELPQPPEVKIYHSAKDVLEKQRGKLNPLVEKALTKVISENEKEDALNRSKTVNAVCSPSPSSNQNVASMKGIPPALLAKIRAKEAQRMEEALTRKPDEDIKIKIMNRLPEIIRTLRALFVTEKKMALPLEQVYKKLEESYKSGISQRDVELHINMLKDLAPELVSIVEIKRGKFMKLDKNVDIQALISKIQNLTKTKS